MGECLVSPGGRVLFLNKEVKIFFYRYHISFSFYLRFFKETQSSICENAKPIGFRIHIRALHNYHYFQQIFIELFQGHYSMNLNTKRHDTISGTCTGPSVGEWTKESLEVEGRRGDRERGGGRERRNPMGEKVYTQKKCTVRPWAKSLMNRIVCYKITFIKQSRVTIIIQKYFLPCNAAYLSSK